VHQLPCHLFTKTERGKFFRLGGTSAVSNGCLVDRRDALRPLLFLKRSWVSLGGYVIAVQNDEFDRYCERAEGHLPNWSSRFLCWLRQPSSRVARVVVSALLVTGSLFSFLPVLGLWMLPLGLIIIAQDLPFLKAPLVVSFQRTEAAWELWQNWRRSLSTRNVATRAIRLAGTQ